MKDVKIKKNQLHTVSRTRQGRQREPVLRHSSFFTLCRILEVLCVEWQNSTPRFPWTLERKNGNINLNKYYLLECGSNPQPVGFTVKLCAGWSGLNDVNSIFFCNTDIIYLATDHCGVKKFVICRKGEARWRGAGAQL